MRKRSEMKVTNLELEIEALNTKYLTVCKSLKLEQKNDKKKVELLSSTCYYTIQYLEKLTQKGEHIINISNVCQKFETDREKLVPYFLQKVDKFSEENVDLEEEGKNELVQSQAGL